MTTAPEDPVAAAMKAIIAVADDFGTDNVAGDAGKFARAALEAAAPLIIEQERTEADAMKLGGMQIEVAVLRAVLALGLPRRQSVMRVLKDLYRAGVSAGIDIWRLNGPPEPEAVAAIRHNERQRLAGIASELRAVFPADHPPGAMASFADYIRTYAGAAGVTRKDRK